MCGCTRHFTLRTLLLFFIWRIHNTECACICWMSVICFVIICINGATWRDLHAVRNLKRWCVQNVCVMYIMRSKSSRKKIYTISRFFLFADLFFRLAQKPTICSIYVYFQSYLQIKHTTQIISFARVTAVRLPGARMSCKKSIRQQERAFFCCLFFSAQFKLFALHNRLLLF